MELITQNLSREALKNAPQSERVLFFGLAHAANEINALLRLVFWSVGAKEKDVAIQNGQIALSCMFLRLLAGKLNEANGLLERKYYGAALSTEYSPRLPAHVQGALSRIKSYFSRANPIREVRRSLAFHYSPEQLDEALDDYADDLVLYLQRAGSINNLYFFSEALAVTATSRVVDVEGSIEGLRSFDAQVVEVAGWITLAIDGIMAEFIARLPGGGWEGKPVIQKFKRVPEAQRIHLPWFVENP